jgi:hypothetical protein
LLTAWRRQQFNLSHLCIISNQQPFPTQGHCTQRSSDLVFVYDNLRRPPELSLRTCESVPILDNGDLRTCCIASSVSNRGARQPKPWCRPSSSFQEHGESLRKVVYVNSSRSTRFGKSKGNGVSLSLSPAPTVRRVWARVVETASFAKKTPDTVAAARKIQFWVEWKLSSVCD